MPVSAEHQRLPMGAATMAPSHFNTQPWRYVLVDDEGIIGEIARIGGESVRRLMEALPAVLQVLRKEDGGEERRHTPRPGTPRPEAFWAPDILGEGTGHHKSLRRPGNPR